MADTINQERAELIKQWEVLGPSRVQEALMSPAISIVLGAPHEPMEVREWARDWITTRIERDQRRSICSNRLLALGAVAGVIAAIGALIATIPVWSTVVTWFR